MFSRPEISAIAGGQWTSHDAAFYFFWVRTPRLACGLVRRLLDVLSQWFAHDWVVAHPLFISIEQVAQQVAVNEGVGLRLSFWSTFPIEPHRSLAHAWAPAGE